MRSTLMPLNPNLRACENVVRVISSLCLRLTASCTFGSRSCTPKLILSKPRFFNAVSFSALSANTVLGSTSIEISASGKKVKRSRKEAMRVCSSASSKLVGVPPPKWSCDTSTFLPNKLAAVAISWRRSAR